MQDLLASSTGGDVLALFWILAGGAVTLVLFGAVACWTWHEAVLAASEQPPTNPPGAPHDPLLRK